MRGLWIGRLCRRVFYGWCLGVSFISCSKSDRIVWTNVGPIPPLVTTKSYFSLMRVTASMISASSSAMTSTRFRCMPIEKQYFAKNAELVSTVFARQLSTYLRLWSSSFLNSDNYGFNAYLAAQHLIPNNQACRSMNLSSAILNRSRR